MDRKKIEKIINNPCILLNASQVSEVKSLLIEALQEIDQWKDRAHGAESLAEYQGDQLKNLLENGPTPQGVGRGNLGGKENK